MSTTPTTPTPTGPPAPTRPRRRFELRVPARSRVRPGARATERAGALAWARGHGMVVAIVAALALSALTLLFPSTPSYDPWAWIQWGREITHLDLVTDTG